MHHFGIRKCGSHYHLLVYGWATRWIAHVGTPEKSVIITLVRRVQPLLRELKPFPSRIAAPNGNPGELVCYLILARLATHARINCLASYQLISRLPFAATSPSGIKQILGGAAGMQ